jgi:3-(3-hydroxy-phenyl)propionate hydroxylase
MHHPTSQPRPSLYYNYQVFEPWLAREHPHDERQQVVIVGSGPAGMVTALELARHGVACVILTSELQFSQGSRAIVFTRRSMEILQQVGVADRMTQIGLPWRCGNSFYRGQRVFRMQAPHDDDDRFFPMINVQQQYMEEYLYDACKANPLIDFRWGNLVTGVQQHDDQAVLTVDTPEGPYELTSSWVVAADGGRSPLRAAMQLQMEGTSYEGFFVIADIKIDLPFPTERLAFFDPIWNPGNTILMHRQPHGIWRVDYQLSPGESPQDALRESSLRACINAQLDMIGYGGTPWELDWSSVYSARTLTLPDFVHQRVIFTGDAAHLLPIFGVRGANTAFQDAQSLGWHLAYVVKGLASTQLLRNYSEERVGAAREIIHEAGKSTRFMSPPTEGFKLLRNAVLSLSLTQEFVRPLFHWRTSRAHAYSHSMLNAADDDHQQLSNGLAQGEPAQNVRLNDHDYLLDHVGGGFDLLYFTTNHRVPVDVMASVIAARAKGVAVRVVAVANHEVGDADVTLIEGATRMAERYGVEGMQGAYLLRPDQHVCARWRQLRGEQLTAALDKALP